MPESPTPVPGRPLGRGRRLAAPLLALVGVLLMVGGYTLLKADYLTMKGTGSSMLPTYPLNSEVTARKTSGSQVHAGDVVLIRIPQWGYDQPVLKRVAGVGGDHVVLPMSGDLTVNGKKVDEPYLFDGIANGLPYDVDVTVPAGRLFLLGDHRTDSVDSRLHLTQDQGTVPASGVAGRAIDDSRVRTLFTTAELLGLLLIVSGAALALANRVVRRRRNNPPPPAATRW